jgi:DNA (cytosine-5)-methyltransferase 1|nr:MAG TPA: Cytosine specific methyltransferase [Caudoviricetes sp.]
MKSIQAIDLFCGAGGLSYGLLLEGINVVAGVDIDSYCKFPYEKNIGASFIEKSVSDISSNELNHFWEDSSQFTLLAGCAPCQTFSQYNAKASPKDKRWFLLNHFQRLMEEMEPDFVTMENVPGLMSHPVYNMFLTSLENKGYFIDASLVDCTKYGLAQTRSRLVLIASKLAPIKLISPDEFGAPPQTVRDVIGALPLIESGKTHSADPLHSCSNLSKLNMKRIKASLPDGSWKDWPDELVAKCHKKNSGKSYPSVYGRMSWDKPAPTITTQFYGFGNGRFGHPEQDRALSLREGALLQGFPVSYEFAPSNSITPKRVIGRMIGNAVPVTLGRVIARSLVLHAQQQ